MLEREDTINLAVYEATPDESEFIATELRNGGHAVKAFGFENVSELGDILGENRIDLILSSPDPKELSATVRQASYDDYKIPVIAAASDLDTASVILAMQGGAKDLVSKNQPEHLRLVIERELLGTQQCRSAAQFIDAYKESEKRCRSLLDSSRDAISYIHDGMHIYANQVYVEMFGFNDPEDLEGLPILDMVAEDKHAKLKEFIANYGKQREAKNVDITCIREDGTEFEAAMEFTRASIDGEACTQVIIRDQGIDETVINELEMLKTQDPITGLYNRQAFLEEMELAIHDVLENKKPGTIMYIEIDDFDALKTIMGIENIDEAISAIGKLISDKIDDHDFGARFGEHVFTILTRETNVKKIGAKSRRILKALDSIIEAGDKSTPVSASMGLAAISDTVDNAYEILACVESACRAAREKGGNTIEAYRDPKKAAERKASQEELRWVKLITNALEKNRFKLAFQPIVSLKETEEEIYEALLRLNDENGEEIKPGQFLQAAEKTGMINKIDRWVIARALHLLADKQKEGGNTNLFVKLSGYAYTDESLLPWLYERTKASRVDSSRLIFEISESDATTHVNKIAHFCRTLKKMRCRIVLSKFGLSDNPFKLLKTIPVDYLKVSGELSGKIGEDPNMMEKMIELVAQAHDLGKPVVAPHVENAESMAVVFQCGFDFIQGNFLQEPDIVMQFDFGDNEASTHIAQSAS